jgi:hypothetical protein
MVALPAMAAWVGMLRGSGKAGSGDVCVSMDAVGSVACLIRRGSWPVLGSLGGGGILSVFEDGDGILAGDRACKCWRQICVLMYVLRRWDEE